jgi:O-methyltransferase
MKIWQRIRDARDQIARIERTLKAQRQDGREHHGRLVDEAARQRAAMTTLSERQQKSLAELSAAVHAIRRQLDRPRDERLKAVEASLADLRQSMGQAQVATERVVAGVTKVSAQVRRTQARLSRIGGPYDEDADAAFLEVADPLRESRRTMLGYDRLFTLWQAAGNVARLGLPVVEVGSFRGGSAALIAEALRRAGGAALELHVVDTFAGHIDDSFTDHDVEEQRGKFRGTDAGDVREFLGAYPGVQVHQGDAATVVRAWPERRYGLVHVDVDLYGPTRDCLTYFGPRLAVGGVIVVDDFGSPTCPGVDTATGEFLQAHSGYQSWKLEAEQMVLVKISDR